MNIRTTGIDWRFVVSAFFLFVITASLPLTPLFIGLFSTVSGLKLSVMIVELSLFLFVFTTYSHARLCAANPRWWMLFVVWLAWVFVSALLSDSFIPSLVRFAELLCHLLFLMSLLIVFGTSSQLRLLVKIYLVGGFVLYASLLGSLLFTTELGPDVKYDRLFVGFHNIRNFGHYSLFVLLFVFELLKFSEQRKNVGAVLLCYFLAVVVWTFLFVIGGRGPFFALFVAFSVLLMVYRQYLTRIYVGAVLTSLILGLIFSLPLSVEGFGVQSIYEGTVSADSLNDFSSGRMAIWGDVFQRSLSVPFFGEGPEGYLFTVSQERHPTTVQPHGLLPQIVLEWGWVGATLFLLLLAKTLLPVYYRIRQPNERDAVLVGSFVTLVAIVAFSLIDGVLYHPRTTLLFCVVLALLLSELFDKEVISVQKIPRLLFMVGALPLLLVVFMHALSVSAATKKSVKDQNSPEITYLKLFPSALADPGVAANLARWPHFWSDHQVGVEVLSLYYRWAENNSSRPWLFAYLNASQLYRAGEKELADAVMLPYAESAPDYIRNAYNCVQLQ